MLASPIVAPRELQRCISKCTRRAGYTQCWYDEKPKCGKREQVCVETDKLDCTPRAVNLGSWNPIPDGYKPEYDGTFKDIQTLTPESYEMKAP